MVSGADKQQEIPVLVYVGLGANLGQKEQTLCRAIEQIVSLNETELVSSSSFYRTEPIEASGEDYVNAVLAIKTKLSARALLHELQRIEKEYGRVRPKGVLNAPRTLDLDLLLYGDLKNNDSELIIPHPRMTERAFVLIPLRQITSKEFLLEGRALNEWISHVQDQRVERL